MKRFQGKTVLITGGSRGVGRATAEEFAKEGARVVVNYVASSEAQVNEFTAHLTKTYGIKAGAFKADIADDAAVRAMRHYVETEFGTLDILVNNAAVVIDKPYAEHTRRDFDKIFATNVYGVLNMGKVFGEMITGTATGGGNREYVVHIRYV